jgi:glycosyltransferase involved in cell wall biosynthesis
MVWYWGTSGAGIRLSERMATALADLLGADHVAVSCHADHPGLQRLMERGHPVSTIAGPAGHQRRADLALHAAPRLLQFWRHLRRHRPQMVIVPMNFALAWPFARLARALGTRLVYMVHDAEPHSGDFAPRWQRLTQRRLVANADALIAPSTHTAAEIARLYPQAPPVTVLPLSALVAPRRDQPRQPPAGPVRLLFLGRLITYKGLDRLAEALAPLADRRDWTLTIAGAGPEEAAVRAAFGGMAQVDLSMLRHLAEAEIEVLIDRHDVLVSPYRDASQSGAIPEALAAGMPCLVTPVGGLPEQIGGGAAGWLARENSGPALRAAIEQMLTDRAGYPERSAAALQLAGHDPGTRLSDALTCREQPREKQNRDI